MDYEFYVNQYGGSGISQAQWPELARRAQEKLAQFQRQYQVRGDARAIGMAICAMAEAIGYFTAAQNGQGGLRYASVGSVSVSGKGIYSQVDISPEAQQRELYRCMGQYLTVYRGVQ